MTKTTTDKPSKAWDSPPQLNSYRQNELFRRYRQIVLEMSGAGLTELADKEHRQYLEKHIVADFAKLNQKYRSHD